MKDRKHRTHIETPIEKNAETKNPSPRNPKITSKQVVAMSGVILLVLLYLVTLVLAVVDHSASGRFFILSLCCTLVVPIIVFLYSWMWARLTGSQAPGDPDPKQP